MKLKSIAVAPAVALVSTLVLTPVSISFIHWVLKYLRI